MKQFNLLKCLLFSSTFFLSACITVGNVKTQEPAKVEDRVVIDGRVLPLPSDAKIEVEPLSSSQTMSPVASRLLVTSDTQSRNGDWDSAANSIERALRLEPRNATLWSRLAGIRYQQNDWQQAIQLAAKSNTLSGSSSDLRRQNWNMMANAYEVLGDIDSAHKYRQMLSP